MRPLTPVGLSIALALLGPLGAALAQDPVQTPALEGRFQVQVTSSSARRTIAPGAELDVSSNGRLRLTIGGKRVRLARVGETLYGRMPAVAPGIISTLSGGGGLPAATLRLRIRGADELSGTISSNEERTRLVLRRVSAVDDALIERARRYVMANAGDGDEAPFPRVDSGEDGLYAYLLTGAAADRVVAFTKAWHEGEGEVESFRLDHSRQVVIALRSTFDEEDFYCAVLDRATGAGRLLGDRMGVVDLSYTLDQQTLDRILPGIGDIEDVDHYHLIDKLVEGGADIDLTADGFALRHWATGGEEVRIFRDEEEWRAWYDSGSPTGRWLYRQEDENDHATYVCGSDDLWHVVIKVTRATGVIEVVGEH